MNNLYRRNKYNAKKVFVGNDVFDSKKEYERWKMLVVMERTLHISALQRQVPFTLIPKQEGLRSMKYIVDFIYIENDKIVCEDVKGARKGSAYQLFMVKKKLMMQKYGLKVVEI